MRKVLALFLALVLVFSLGANTAVQAAPSSKFITTTPTGYDSADDVQYKTYSVSGRTVISNWGARGEECVFLTTYADAYYSGNYEWDTLSGVKGGTTQTNAHFSQLYSQLQRLMTDTHVYYTYYDDSQSVRAFYKYTDCVSNNTSQVSLLYRGGLVTSAWNSGKTWNQEHVWPKSKFSEDLKIRGDLMHLRPANPSENSSRSNTAYGESSGYYNPGPSVRGDCARMILYMYVRWGLSSTMWGKSGVMENMNVLLKWIEEDPVDTWEMARNDSVQSVTGVRNVFVDYPEYAFLLFGKDIPEDMVTPSGEGADATPPVVTPPVVTPPVVEPPVNTEPPVTEPPVTEPPVTEPPVTNPPVTDAPATEPAPTTPSQPSDDNTPDNTWLWVVLAVAIAGTVVVIIIVTTKKRK